VKEKGRKRAKRYKETERVTVRRREGEKDRDI
jgi:hypothetical protein